VASSFLGGALAESGAYTQNILQNLAPALAGGTPAAARSGPFFPLGSAPTTSTSPASPAAEPGFNAYNDAGF